MPLFCFFWGGHGGARGSHCEAAHDAMLGPRCSADQGAAKARPDQITVSKLFLEFRNKKSVRIATFLRLAIAASSPIANRGTKTQVICRVKAPISLCRDREEFVIAKKLQRCRDFCFHDGRIVPTGRFHDGGGSPQRGKSRRCAYSRRQCGQQRLGSLIGRGAPPGPCRVGLGGGPCAEGFAADWTERQPLGLEAAGEGRLWVWFA